DGEALETITDKGTVFVNGEIWNAVVKDGLVEKGSKIKVVGVRDGLVLEVEAAGE
ncbi:MAG: nodulation protein NfeD, partial [Candidatus Dadabacteria bacterium]